MSAARSFMGGGILTPLAWTWGVGGALLSIRARRAEGKGLIRSVVAEAAQQTPWFFGVLPGFALTIAAPMAPTLGQALTQAHYRSQAFRRKTYTPFSQKFEWSDAATRSYQAVTASLNGSALVGGEAARMHARYARR